MRCGSAAWSITRSREKKRIVVFEAVVNSKHTDLGLASGLTVASPLGLWIRANSWLAAWRRGYQSRPSRAVDKSKHTDLSLLGIGANCRAPPMLWIRIYRTVTVLLQIVCIGRLPPAVLCCHSDRLAGSDWLAGVVCCDVADTCVWFFLLLVVSVWLAIMLWDYGMSMTVTPRAACAP